MPVQTADESVFVLSIVTQSYGTPSVSATICVCTVFEPWPMSTVPEKTSTRPSGLSLIHAWLGSPFWFMPVGYSIVANPRPRVLRHQRPLLPFEPLLGDEVLGQQVAGARLGRHRPVLGGQLDADALGRGERRPAPSTDP